MYIAEGVVEIVVELNVMTWVSSQERLEIQVLGKPFNKILSLCYFFVGNGLLCFPQVWYNFNLPFSVTTWVLQQDKQWTLRCNFFLEW